jgi:cell division protein FtsL
MSGAGITFIIVNLALIFTPLNGVIALVGYGWFSIVWFASLLLIGQHERKQMEKAAEENQKTAEVKRLAAEVKRLQGERSQTGREAS